MNNPVDRLSGKRMTDDDAGDSRPKRKRMAAEVQRSVADQFRPANVSQVQKKFVSLRVHFYTIVNCELQEYLLHNPRTHRLMSF